MKIKVESATIVSAERKPVDRKPEITVTQISQNRDYAHYVFQQRLDSVALRHKDDIKKLYLPYVHNTQN